MEETKSWLTFLSWIPSSIASIFREQIFDDRGRVPSWIWPCREGSISGLNFRWSPPIIINKSHEIFRFQSPTSQYRSKSGSYHLWGPVPTPGCSSARLIAVLNVSRSVPALIITYERDRRGDRGQGRQKSKRGQEGAGESRGHRG